MSERSECKFNKKLPDDLRGFCKLTAFSQISWQEGPATINVIF
jgi:hypothetical protein